MEVLSGFVNGIFLVFISIFVFIEAIDRVLDPPEIHTERLMLVSVGGLLVNIVGMVAFSHAHTHGGAPCKSHGSGGGDHGHSHESTSAAAVAPTPSAVSHAHGHSHDTHTDDHSHSHAHSHSHSHAHSHGPSSSAACTTACATAVPVPSSAPINAPADHGHEHGGHAHRNANMEGPTKRVSSALAHLPKKIISLLGVFLHVLADALGSVGVMISTFLVEWYDMRMADPLCSIFIGVLIFISVIPLLKSSTRTLLQRTPKDLEKDFDRALHDVRENMSGILFLFFSTSFSLSAF